MTQTTLTSQDTNTTRPIARKLKVVGCDLDDVLADFMTTFIDMASRRFNVPENKSLRPIDWAWSNMGWTKGQEAALWQELHDTVDFWTHVRPMPNVDSHLVRRLAEKTTLYFPTARAQSLGNDVQIQSAMWLLNTFDIPFPQVIVSNEKGPLAAALKYDYFIDDRDKNCIAVKQARPECRVFLCEASHNQALKHEDYGIERVSGFNEFAGIVLSEE
jgi:5'(3')-deoxyribonucleotidase